MSTEKKEHPLNITNYHPLRTMKTKMTNIEFSMDVDLGATDANNKERNQKHAEELSKLNQIEVKKEQNSTMVNKGKYLESYIQINYRIKNKMYCSKDLIDEVKLKPERHKLKQVEEEDKLQSGVLPRNNKIADEHNIILLFELIEEHKMKEIITHKASIKKPLLKIRYLNKRNIFHQAALHGNFLAVLYFLFVEDLGGIEDKLEALFEIDQDGCSPFELACIRGYYTDKHSVTTKSQIISLIESHLSGGNEELAKFINDLEVTGSRTIFIHNHITKQTSKYEMEEAAPFSHRFICIKTIIGYLLNIATTSKSGKEVLIQKAVKMFEQNKNGYNPLHWALFNGDYSLSIFLFRLRPMMIFEENKKGQTPFGMILYSKSLFQVSIIADNLINIIIDEFIDFFTTSNTEEEIFKKITAMSIEETETRLRSKIETKNIFELIRQIDSEKKLNAHYFIDMEAYSSNINNALLLIMDKLAGKLEGKEQKKINKDALDRYRQICLMAANYMNFEITVEKQATASTSIIEHTKSKISKESELDLELKHVLKVSPRKEIKKDEQRIALVKIFDDMVDIIGCEIDSKSLKDIIVRRKKRVLELIKEVGPINTNSLQDCNSGMLEILSSDANIYFLEIKLLLNKADKKNIATPYFDSAKEKLLVNIYESIMPSREEDLYFDKDILEKTDINQKIASHGPQTIMIGVQGKAHHRLGELLQRILPWVLYLGKNIGYKWISEFGLNPFKLQGGMNTLHIICRLHLNSGAPVSVRHNSFIEKSLKKLTKKNFVLKNNSPITWKEILAIKTNENYDTALHYCCYNSASDLFSILAEKVKVDDITEVNLRGWTYHDMIPSSHPNFKIIKKNVQERKTASLLEESELTLNWFHQQIYESQPDETLCLVALEDNIYRKKLYASDTRNQPKSIVEGQLFNVQSNCKRKFNLKMDSDNLEFRVLSPEGRRRKLVVVFGSVFQQLLCFWRVFMCARRQDIQNYNIYTLRIGDILMKNIFQNEGLIAYNMVDGYLEQYNKENEKKYENFKEIDQNYVIRMLLSDEVDIDLLRESSILIDMFPLHNYRRRKIIVQYWKEHFFKILCSPIIPFFEDKQILFIVVLISHYYGVQHGMFFQFVITFTSWCLLIGVFGLVVYILGILFNSFERDPRIMLICAIVVSIWALSFYLSWRRTEKAIAYLLDTKGYKTREERMQNVSGSYRVNSVSRSIDKSLGWSAFWKRLFFSDSIFLLLGIICLIGNFLVYVYLRDNIEFGIAAMTIPLLSNVLGNKIITLIYQVFSDMLVIWENHRYFKLLSPDISVKRLIVED